jgi:TetR/AcrR family transcriptional regulator, transcriptional repressor for nem operon
MSATPGLSAAERLTGYFNEMVEHFVSSSYQRACLAGKFSTEVAATNEAFREQLGKNLRGWKADITELLKTGQGNGDTRRDRDAGDLADAILAMIQGAFVVTLSNRDNQSLQAIGNTIPLLVNRPAS